MRTPLVLGALLIALAAGACSDAPAGDRSTHPARESPSSDAPAATVATPTPTPTSTKPRKERPEPVVTVPYMIVRKTNDPATKDFEEVVKETLSDPRGWERAGFSLVHRSRTRFRVVLAEGEVVDRLCLPYKTYGTYSCQNGPIVALNADRWRTATPKWTGTLEGYKRMLVNHEFGHLLGQHHPEVQCPEPGREAPIMAQQSTELNGCLPNPWPLPHEIRRAARHDLPLAPGYGE